MTWLRGDLSGGDWLGPYPKEQILSFQDWVRRVCNHPASKGPFRSIAMIAQGLVGFFLPLFVHRLNLRGMQPIDNPLTVASCFVFKILVSNFGVVAEDL